jgi:RimJ/RimL family protein N-acetyltransferase
MSRHKNFDSSTTLTLNKEDSGVTVRSLRFSDITSLFYVKNLNKEHIKPYEKLVNQESIDSSAFSIVYKKRMKKEKLVGEIVLSEFDEIDQSCFLSIWVDKDFNNLGIATKAIKIVKDHSFNTLGVYEIRAVVQQGNSVSKRVLTKNGFKLKDSSEVVNYLIDGTLKSHNIYKVFKQDQEVK